MNNIHTFRNFLQLNVRIHHSNFLFFLIKIQGIRSSYPSRALIFHSDNPQLNRENLAIYLKGEISSKFQGAQSN